MNKKIASALVGILLIGIVAAGLVPYLSNMVTGSVEVKGPVFYVASDNELLMNEFDGSTEVYDIIDGHNEVFLTISFSDTLNFYRPSLDMYIKAKVASGIVPKNLNLEFGYFDSSGDFKEICDGTVSILSDTFDVYDVPNCAGSSELTGVKGFYYRITGMGTSDVTYEISVEGGNTKTEMNKAT